MDLSKLVKRIYQEKFMWLANEADDIDRMFDKVDIWVRSCKKDDPNKMKALYWKAHQNPIFLLSLPFIYAFLNYQAIKYTNEDYLNSLFQEKLNQD